MNKLLSILLVVMLSGCGGSHIILGSKDYYYTNPSDIDKMLGAKVEKRFREGSGSGWPTSEVEVLLDAKVNGLRMRHVRVESDECKTGYMDHIELDGFIGADSTVMVERLIKRLAPCISPSNGRRVSNNIYLSSAGGYLYDGYSLGKLFRENGMTTVVTGHQECASSCATAFLGGLYRKMSGNGVLIFHSPYTRTGIGINCDDKGQVSGLAKYYNQYMSQNDSKLLLERTLSYCSTKNGWTINAGAAALYNITN